MSHYEYGGPLFVCTLRAIVRYWVLSFVIIAQLLFIDFCSHAGIQFPDFISIIFLILFPAWREFPTPLSFLTSSRRKGRGDNEISAWPSRTPTSAGCTVPAWNVKKDACFFIYLLKDAENYKKKKIVNVLGTFLKMIKFKRKQILVTGK